MGFLELKPGSFAHGCAYSAEAMDGREQWPTIKISRFLTMDGLMSRSTRMCESDHCRDISSDQEKTLDTSVSRVFGIKTWQWPTFTWGNPTLSSALSSFTSEFGKGSGGSRLQWPPGKLVGEKDKILITEFGKCESSFSGYAYICASNLLQSHLSRLLGCYMVKPHEQLVLVSFIHYCTSTSSLSTS